MTENEIKIEIEKLENELYVFETQNGYRIFNDQELDIIDQYYWLIEELKLEL